ncbi:hypothetical protein Tco_0620706 [Tanacetum coccineum]
MVSPSMCSMRSRESSSRIKQCEIALKIRGTKLCGGTSDLSIDACMTSYRGHHEKIKDLGSFGTQNPNEVYLKSVISVFPGEGWGPNSWDPEYSPGKLVEKTSSILEVGWLGEDITLLTTQW